MGSIPVRRTIKGSLQQDLFQNLRLPDLLPYSLKVRILGFHPRGPGALPGVGTLPLLEAQPL